MDPSHESFICPHCGEPVPIGAKSCPECGSDDRTGWSEEAQSECLDLPPGTAADDEFDYDAYIRREFGWDQGRASKPAIPARDLIKMVGTFIIIAILIWWLV